MSSPLPHKRVLPHVDVSEQGLRELELWLRGRAATASTGTALTVQDEGVALPVEPIMNFVGSGVTAVDDPGGTRTTVTISGTGIQFDTSPQTGGFLEVTTLTGSITIEDTSGNGLYLNSNDGAGGGGFVQIGTDDGEVIIASTLIVNRLSNHGAATFQVQYPNSDQYLYMTDTGFATLNLLTSTTFEIVGPSSASKFKVSEDGTVSMPALPTSNPGGSGLLWNSAGTLKIT